MKVISLFHPVFAKAVLFRIGEGGNVLMKLIVFMYQY